MRAGRRALGSTYLWRYWGGCQAADVVGVSLHRQDSLATGNIPKLQEIVVPAGDNMDAIVGEFAGVNRAFVSFKQAKEVSAG